MRNLHDDCRFPAIRTHYSVLTLNLRAENNSSITNATNYPTNYMHLLHTYIEILSTLQSISHKIQKSIEFCCLLHAFQRILNYFIFFLLQFGFKSGDGIICGFVALLCRYYRYKMPKFPNAPGFTTLLVLTISMSGYTSKLKRMNMTPHLICPIRLTERHKSKSTKVGQEANGKLESGACFWHRYEFVTVLAPLCNRMVSVLAK